MSSRTPLIAVPGLYWPAPGLRARLAEAQLPGLRALFAMARPSRGPARSFDAWLCSLFGAGEHADLASLRLAGEDEPIPAHDGGWLCADPVHFEFAREHLLLRPFEADEVSLDEARALVAALNTEFSDLGRFFAASPTRWYLAAAQPTAVELPSLADASGRPVAYFQPTGPDRALWARSLNELQVFCHNHPLNAERGERGLLPINGLWLWGKGDGPDPRAPAVQGCGNASPLLLGLCRSADMSWRDSHEFEPDTPLQFFTALAEPARRRDERAWLQALHDLDVHVFSPLAAALDVRSLEGAQLVAPGDGATLALELAPLPRWRLWGRRVTSLELAGQLSPEAATSPAGMAPA